MSRFLSLALAGAVALAGCDAVTDAAPESAQGTAVLYGAPAPLGNGTARVYVTRSRGAAPTAFGVVLTANAVDGLPARGDGHDDHEHGTKLVLPLPPGARAAGIATNHVDIGWNPEGHEPAGLFTIPHFDFHFYTVSPDEVASWTPGAASWPSGNALPAEAYRPPGFIADPSGAVVPQMGLHWLDPTDPTYAPGGPGFTEVFLYGSYGGRMVFAEPMITRDYLLALRASGAVHEEALMLPPAVAVSGLYPTTYSVRFDRQAGGYRIELGGLVYRTAS